MKNYIMIKRIFIFLILFFVILSINNVTTSFADGQVEYNDGHYMYKNENGTYAKNCWRWIDTDNDNVCECYRFDENGWIVGNYESYNGKRTNELGQWVLNGVVQQVYRNNGQPLRETNFNFAYIDNNNYIKTVATTSTASDTTKESVKRINASGKNLEAMKNKTGTEVVNRENPQAEFEGTGEKGYLVGKNAKVDTPKADSISGQVVDSALKEDEIKVLGEGEVLVLGKDLRRFIDVDNSKKYTEKVTNVKIYGGEIWEDAILLSGNGAYIKFNLKDNNYLRFEVAHQTHGESTADTDCRLDLYIGDNVVASYDEFNDSDPEVVEEWFQDGEKKIMLKLVITGDAPGRKVYLHNARLRKVKDEE